MMLSISLYVLGAAALGGMGLVALASARSGAPPARLAYAHGATGFLGFVLLLVGLAGPVRGVAHGSGSFGVSAAVLVGGALAAGVTMLAVQMRGRPVSGAVVAIHASFAVAGVVMLAAYVAL